MLLEIEGLPAFGKLAAPHADVAKLLYIVSMLRPRPAPKATAFHNGIFATIGWRMA